MIYQQFNTGSDIVAGRTQTVSSGFFNDGNYSVSQSFFSYNSTQIQTTGSGNYNYLNGLYYWNVYYNNQVHFSVAYGDLNSSGSSATDLNLVELNPFEANYQSYVNLLLNPTDKQFSFLTGAYSISSNTLSTSTIQSPSIFIMNFEANLYKNQVDQGQLQFSLKGNNGTTFSFIDDSSILNKTSNVYNIIQGTISNGIQYPVTVNGTVQYQSLGLFYPRNGIVILNAAAITSLLGGMTGVDATQTAITYPSSYNNLPASSTNFNTYQSCLYYAIVNASTTSMNVRKSELIPTTQYYVRVQNSLYNYTNNPTFVSDGTDGLTRGTIKIPYLQTNPTTYITTVGLYDPSNELVAVAKLSTPAAKSFDNEYLIKVSLAY
jgi:hypothetical protein